MIIHVLTAVFWLGGGAYERLFLVREIRSQRGRPSEVVLMHLMVRPERTIQAVVALLVATGALLSLAYGMAPFSVLWLGLKQGILLAILVMYLVWIGPGLHHLRADVERLRYKKDTPGIGVRRRFGRLVTGLDLVHLGVLANLVLAFLKPV